MGILLVFSLCVCLPRCFSQSVTQSPAAVTRKECQSLTITCIYYGHNWGYYFQNGYFFRQTQTGTERERIFSGGRFVESVNKAEKTFSLEIRDVRVEDTATYYCKAQYWYWHTVMGLGLRKYDNVDGSGTVVTVTAGSSSLVSKNPSLQISAADDTVTLSCEYSGICQYTVHWYSQPPGQALKYLLQKHTSGGGNKENAAGERISASIDSVQKISRLKISKLQLSDSAVYYCGLKCANSTQTLIFGNGTRLIVEPIAVTTELRSLPLAKGPNSLWSPEREASLLSLLCAKRKSPNYPVSAFEAKGPVEPTLSVFYPPVPRGATGIDTAAVCLASDFSPNAIMLSLYTGSGQEANVTRPSVLLESGNYRSSGFLSFRQSEKSPNITCKAFHDNRNYSVNIPPTAEIDKPKCPTGRSDSLTESSDTENDRLRVNFLSLTVMGLRILFFKSIVFNVMMTARVWLF
ncbi:T cell receptor alpha chain MC.7.G5-like [Mustelus asterias]